MYDLPYFKEKDRAKIIAFMREHPFAFITGVNEKNEPVATQVPVFVDEKDGKLFLTGHIMKNSDHHKAFMQNENVLAVFTGPSAYISATWYDDPVQASTWNYMSVHAKGIARFGGLDDLISILKRLTLHYEKYDKSSPTIFDNLPEDYTHRLMKAIVAFEIEVTGMENVFKLSQNRNRKTYDNIITNLEQQDEGGKYLAARMRENVEELFGKQSDSRSV